jgi:hypothetical protein
MNRLDIAVILIPNMVATSIKLTQSYLTIQAFRSMPWNKAPTTQCIF